MITICLFGLAIWFIAMSVSGSNNEIKSMQKRQKMERAAAERKKMEQFYTKPKE